MSDTIKAALLSVVISFAVPTLVVASKWGSYETNQDIIMKKLDKIDKKVDKLSDKVSNTREKVSNLEGRVSR